MTVREISGIPVRPTASRAHNTVGLVWRISARGWCVALGLGVAFSTSASAADKDPWTIRILPATKLMLAQATPPKAAPAPAPHEPGAKTDAKAYEPAPAPTAATPAASGQLRIIPGPTHSAGPARRTSYSEVYRSIPFSWAEYSANPSYRSQAALGLMLNQMPYPSASQSPVPQYGYVAPYTYDNTYGTPTSYNVLYSLPAGGW